MGLSAEMQMASQSDTADTAHEPKLWAVTQSSRQSPISAADRIDWVAFFSNGFQQRGVSPTGVGIDSRSGIKDTVYSLSNVNMSRKHGP